MKLKLLPALCCALILASCNPDKGPEPKPEPKPEEKPYILQKEDITVEQPADGFVATANKLLRITVQSVSDEGVSYLWLLDDQQITQTKNLEYMFDRAGQYKLTLRAQQSTISFDYQFDLRVDLGEITPPAEGATAYITKVLDYMPAVGQFTNQMPKYESGDTQLSMNAKALASIGNNKRGLITLGGYGGYVTVGFDHTIQNVEGKRDFRVLGNAFYGAGNPDETAPDGGSCEPGIIMVAYDANGNGTPDDNEWYEIAGSAHVDPTGELWYQKAKNAGNDVTTYSNYQITYFRPTAEPETEEEMATYIRWEDNQGKSGYKVKNIYHNQPYFPQWVTTDKITFTGTCLPQNSVNEGDADMPYYVLYKYRYGYADNELNAEDESAIDISWAINEKGQPANLPGVDFIKIYTGVNQESGWLGECSTDISGIEDLHLLGVSIDTRK